MTILEGWVDEIGSGWVYGRIVSSRGTEYEFEMPLLRVLESQRVYLQPGSYVYLVNGFLMVNNAMLTTHDMETASREAKRRYKELGWDAPLPQS